MITAEQIIRLAEDTAHKVEVKGLVARAWLANEHAYDLIAHSPLIRHANKSQREGLALMGIPVCRTNMKAELFINGARGDLVLLTERK